MKIKDQVYLDLTVDFDRAMKGWKTEKDANVACQKFVSALQLQLVGIKLERTVERGVIVAGVIYGGYKLIKK
jgi:hypothetical protein